MALSVVKCVGCWYRAKIKSSPGMGLGSIPQPAWCTSGKSTQVPQVSERRCGGAGVFCSNHRTPMVKKEIETKPIGFKCPLNGEGNRTMFPVRSRPVDSEMNHRQKISIIMCNIARAFCSLNERRIRVVLIIAQFFLSFSHFGCQCHAIV